MLHLGWLLTVLLLSSRHTDAQFLRYNGHYYTFHTYAPIGSPDPPGDAHTFCYAGWVTVTEDNVDNLPIKFGPQSPGYPVVLNDADEHRELYKFYLENSEYDDAYVWLGASKHTPITEHDCDGRLDKPPGYSCSDPVLPYNYDFSLSTYTAWEPGHDTATSRNAHSVAWRKETNRWELIPDDDPRVREAICEHPAAVLCNLTGVDCFPHGACVPIAQETNNYGCTCDEGYAGRNCEDIANETSTEAIVPVAVGTTAAGASASAAAESTIVSGLSNAAFFGIVIIGGVVVLAGVAACTKNRNQLRRRLSYSPSEGGY